QGRDCSAQETLDWLSRQLSFRAPGAYGVSGGLRSAGWYRGIRPARRRWRSRRAANLRREYARVLRATGIFMGIAGDRRFETNRRGAPRHPLLRGRRFTRGPEQQTLLVRE